MNGRDSMDQPMHSRLTALKETSSQTRPLFVNLIPTLFIGLCYLTAPTVSGGAHGQHCPLRVQPQIQTSFQAGFILNDKG